MGTVAIRGQLCSILVMVVWLSKPRKFYPTKIHYMPYKNSKKCTPPLLVRMSHISDQQLADTCYIFSVTMPAVSEYPKLI